MLRDAVVTLHADRHADDDRAFATSFLVTSGAESLADLLVDVAVALERDVHDYARVTIAISEPFDP